MSFADHYSSELFIVFMFITVHILAQCASSVANNAIVGTQCFEADANALISFIKAANYNYYDYSQWGKNCCQWPVVTCNSLGRFSSLSLSGIAYWPSEDSVSKSLCQLEALTSLELSCQIQAGLSSINQGKIPDCIGHNLTSIRNLTVSYCNLVGSLLPESLSMLNKTLQHLVLSSNGLSIQSSLLHSFTAIDYLDLSGNYISGSILQFLFQLPHVTHIDLSNSSLLGSIPEPIPKLTFLDYLDIDTNQLTGGIPASLSNISSLSYLDLSNNFLTGSIPNSISNLTFLYSLHLSFNNLTGPIPASLTNLSSLEILNLDNNNLSGSIPDLPLLKISLSLSNNHLTGPIPYSVCNIASQMFGYFDLSYNNLSGPIHPTCFSSASGIEYLYLHENNLSGHLPDLPVESSLLYIVNFSNNNFSGSIPASWTYTTFQVTQFIYLNDNKLSGYLPVLPVNLSSLSGIDFSNNYFSGTIPISWTPSTFQQTGIIKLSKNMLSGTIPAYLSSLPNLQALILDNNKLNGTIPSFFGHDMVALMYLNLSHNSLYDNIPYELGNLGAKLESLDLSSNDLSGQIPTSFNNLKNLANFNVSFNIKLNGQIPAQNPQLDQTESYLGDYNLCGVPVNRSYISNTNVSPIVSTTSIYNWLFMPGFVISYVLGLIVTLVILELNSFRLLLLSIRG